MTVLAFFVWFFLEHDQWMRMVCEIGASGWGGIYFMCSRTGSISSTSSPKTWPIQYIVNWHNPYFVIEWNLLGIFSSVFTVYRLLCSLRRQMFTAIKPSLISRTYAPARLCVAICFLLNATSVTHVRMSSELLSIPEFQPSWLWQKFWSKLMWYFMFDIGYLCYLLEWFDHWFIGNVGFLTW